MLGITTTLALEAGTWRVNNKAFEVISGEVLRLGTLPSKIVQRDDNNKQTLKFGKLQVTAADAEEWRLWGESSWRKGRGLATLASGTYRFEWRTDKTVQGRLIAIDQEQEKAAGVPGIREVLVEAKEKVKIIVGPDRDGPAQVGDVAVLRDDQSAIVGWQRLKKPVEQMVQSENTSSALVILYSTNRKQAIESIMKRLGIGTQVDLVAAYSLAQLAAESEDGLGLYSLACCCEFGDGTPKDTERAKILFEKAAPKLLAEAEKSDPWAQAAIGACYKDGLGLLKSPAMGLEWIQKAVNNKLAYAENLLGIMYANGEGVTKDEVEAVKWYRKAADQSHPRAQYNLGVMYANGEGLTKDVVEAVKWFRKASELGVAEAYFNLGYMYAKGEGVTKDEVEAVKWFRKAADLGVARAQGFLGSMYARGQGVTKDESEAVKWFRKAAEQSESEAQVYLGLMYFIGQGVTKDDSEAVKWFRKAAEQGDASAQAYLGFMYAKGRGLTKDGSEAVKWFRKAAEQGDASAQYNLGDMYANGYGVTRDLIMAYKWLLLASTKAAKIKDTDLHTRANDLATSIEQTLTPVQVAEGRRLAAEFKARIK